MSEPRQADETFRVAVEGGEVAVYSYGAASGSCSVSMAAPAFPATMCGTAIR